MDEKINSSNKYIGNKIKERRKKLGISQSDLGKDLGVSYQQIQRYENGINALTVVRLIQIAKTLRLSPEYFYEGMPDANNETSHMSKPRGQLNVLFIDDSAEDEILFKAVVKNFDDQIKIHWMQDPELVIDYLISERNTVNLIMLDINMPKLNGLDLLKKIKNHPLIANIPVVMLTNSIREQEMQESYDNRANGFIQKTTDFNTYRNDVQRTLSYWLKTVILPIKH